MPNKKIKAVGSLDGNDSHMQGQECFKGIFSAERKGGCDDNDEFI